MYQASLVSERRESEGELEQTTRQEAVYMERLDEEQTQRLQELQLQLNDELAVLRELED